MWNSVLWSKSKEKEIKLKENFRDEKVKLGFRRWTKFIKTKGRRKRNVIQNNEVLSVTWKEIFIFILCFSPWSRLSKDIHCQV